MEDDYSGSKPWSFGNKKRLKNHVKGKSEKEIDFFLNKNEIYTRFKQHRKSKKYSPIYVYKKRELFQADVVFFTNPEMVKANHGYKYIFTCIDCFTKMAWVYPLKENTCANILQSFKHILSVCGKQPDRLNSDRGSELICKKFKTFLAELKIFHYLSYSLRKCPIIERFNLTIQNLLYKIMANKRTLNWVNIIEQAMEIYLHRQHTTIKMSPIEAEQDKNEDEVRKNLLIFFKKNSGHKTKPKFVLNDTVRIWLKRVTFQRGYDENYGREFFTVKEVLTNLPVPRYVLKDSKGEDIRGAFFEDELVKFIPNDVFEIEVIGERKRRKKNEYLVHYLGYPKSMDEWITENQLKKL